VSAATLGILLVGLLALLIAVMSLDAAMPRRTRAADGDQDVGPVPAPRPDLRPFAVRVRERAVVVGLAFGMAMTIDRILEDHAYDSWRGRSTWVATIVPPPSAATTRPLRVQPREQSR
jgi:hypothetical protein